MKAKNTKSIVVGRKHNIFALNGIICVYICYIMIIYRPILFITLNGNTTTTVCVYMYVLCTCNMTCLS